jgi:putative flavoprotein involved in K+ transport
MAPTSTLDTLVIGGGQAGLALGYQLQRAGKQFLIVEQNARTGDSWRKRFDSLALFTPRSYSALPGLAVAGDPEGYPTKDEIADYLERYAVEFNLPIALGTGIDRLETDGNRFRATTTAGDVIAARTVVLATGAFQQPAIPAIASQLSPGVTQLTPDSYRNPAQTPGGTVLVVGDGATGRQIARELNGTHQVLLAAGRQRKVSPHRILGKSVFCWMDKLGILAKSPESRIGRKLKAKDPFPGKVLALDMLRAGGITVTGRLESISDRQVRFADGQSAEIDVVIWATGYRDETDWVAIPGVIDARGVFIQDQGISPVPGLYFIGRSWQRSRGSALLTGVGVDAAFIVEQLDRAAEPGIEVARLQPAPGAAGM